MKKIKFNGSFLLSSSDSNDWICRVFACGDGTYMFRFSRLWTGEHFWVVRYTHAEYYLTTGIWHGGNHPTLDRRVRITDFFPVWRISKLPSAYKWGVMV